MKKNFEKPSVIVMDLHCDVICTSDGIAGTLKPGWGPNKGDNGSIDGHTTPGGGNGNGHKIVGFHFD